MTYKSMVHGQVREISERWEKGDIIAQIKDIDFNNIKKSYENKKNALVKKVHKKPLNIVLLGSSNDNRINIKKSLEHKFSEINIIVPETDFPDNYYYSIIEFEKFLFSKHGINLIFINISSPGSTLNMVISINLHKYQKD